MLVQEETLRVGDELVVDELVVEDGKGWMVWSGGWIGDMGGDEEGEIGSVIAGNEGDDEWYCQFDIQEEVGEW